MGNQSARKFGLEKADTTLEESLKGLVKVVSGVSKTQFLFPDRENWLTERETD
jgi:hypothetical protein